jgi:putative CocE/NonD family hydrolase
MKKPPCFLPILLVAFFTVHPITLLAESEESESASVIDDNPSSTLFDSFDLQHLWNKTSREMMRELIKFFYDRPGVLQNLGVELHADEFIDTHDGSKLQISYYLPKDYQEKERHPTVIIVNPWGSSANANQMSRLPQRLVKEGYIVLLLTARGFGMSQGEAAFANETDQKDVSTTLDWLEAHLKTDRSNIGIVGISYGGGIGLMALAHDERLKTAVGMNAWSDLGEGGFLAGGGVNERASRFLVDFGDLMQCRINEAKNFQKKLVDPTQREAVIDWGNVRSPYHVMDKYHQRNAPILFVHTYNDTFFKPNSILEFYKAYQGPKKVSFYLGVHGTNFMFEGYARQGAGDEVIRWFDYWLRGKESRDVHVGAVQFAIRNKKLSRFGSSNSAREAAVYPGWQDQNFNKKVFYLSRAMGEGQLAGESPPVSTSVDLKTALRPSLFKGDEDRDLMLEGFLGWPVVHDLKRLDRKFTALYFSEPLRATKIRSISQLKLALLAPGPAPQVAAYLFAQPPRGKARLITQGAVTVSRSLPGVVTADLDFQAIAYDLEEGERLALVIDTHDFDFYFPPQQNNDLTVLEGGAAGSKLILSTE